MSLRDLLVFAAVFATLPFVLLRPWIGVLLWVWLSVMNPHRLTWGAAYDFPFGQLVAAFTLAGLVFTREPIRLKGGAPAVVLLLFVACSVQLLLELPGAVARDRDRLA